MKNNTNILQEQSFFSVFCIEHLAKKLRLSGYFVYELLTEKSDILDSYIIPNYDSLHTQSAEWIVEDLLEIMMERCVLK